MRQWDDTWPAMRQEAHHGDRVVTCFAKRWHSLHALLPIVRQRDIRPLFGQQAMRHQLVDLVVFHHQYFEYLT